MFDWWQWKSLFVTVVDLQISGFRSKQLTVNQGQLVTNRILRSRPGTPLTKDLMNNSNSSPFVNEKEGFGEGHKRKRALFSKSFEFLSSGFDFSTQTSFGFLVFNVLFWKWNFIILWLFEIYSNFVLNSYYSN